MNWLRIAPVLLLSFPAALRAEVRVYDAPPRNATEIVNALDTMLDAQCKTTNYGCEARLLPTGQILVEAPAEAHQQIGEVLKAIASRNAAPAPRVTLRYWVVSGIPGRPDANQPGLKELAPVLTQLKRAHGDVGFAIEDSVAVVTESGNSAKMGGSSPLEVEENVRVNGRSLSANIKLEYHKLEPDRPPTADELRVSATIEAGQFLVLGERAYRGSDASGAPIGTLFYIVHWPQGE
jgi:hypothetical protein